MTTARLQKVWQFPNLAHHQPDCSAITDEEIKQIVLGRWPCVNGHVDISYTFAPIEYAKQIFYDAIESVKLYAPEPLDVLADPGYQSQVIDNIEKGMQAWSEASSGIIRWHRTASLAADVSFYFADSNRLIGQNNTVAFTAYVLDMTHYFKHVAVVYPKNAGFWEGVAANIFPYGVNTIVHELGHVIGKRHEHEIPSVLDKLRVMPDGVYSGTMSYVHLIETNYSRCYQYCDPPFATLPGPLDKRFLQLVYGHCANQSDNILLQQVKTSSVTFEENILLSAAYSGLHQFCAGLSVQSGTTLLPKRTAQIAADIIYLNSLIYLAFPPVPTAIFALGAGTKYLSKSLSLKTNLFFISAVTYSCVAAQGSSWLLFTTLGATFVESFIGTMMGIQLGHLASLAANKILQSIYVKFQPKMETGEENNTKGQSFISTTYNFFANKIKNTFNKHLIERHLELRNHLLPAP